MAVGSGPRGSHAALDGLRLHYLEWGPPDAPTVVLVHSMGALITAHDWDGVAAALKDTHHVLALDQRGFGLSDRMPTYSFEVMARDLAQFVERLELVGFSLIGHSMGGTVACLYAEGRPDRLRRLVLEDTVPPREGRPDQRREDVQWEFAGFADLLSVARQHGHKGSDEELRARFARAVHQLDGGRVVFRLDPALPPAILAQLADPDPDWWRDLRRISVPTLIVRGGDSPVLDSEQAARAAAVIKDCRVVEIPNAGHSVHGDNPTGFLEAIRDFLASPATTAGQRGDIGACPSDDKA